MAGEYDLRDSVGHWVLTAHRAMHAAFTDRLAGHGLTPPEWVALAVCRAGPVAPAVVADRMRVQRAMVSRLIDGLVAKGLVDLTPDPADGRSKRVALSARGRDLFPALAAASRAVNDRFLAPLSAAERADLLRLLRRVGEAAADGA